MIHPKQTFGLKSLFLTISGPANLQQQFLEAYFVTQIPQEQLDYNTLYFPDTKVIKYYSQSQISSLSHQIFKTINPNIFQSVISPLHLPLIYALQGNQFCNKGILNFYLVKSSITKYDTKYQSLLCLGSLKEATAIQKLNINKTVYHISCFSQLLQEQLDKQYQIQILQQSKIQTQVGFRGLKFVRTYVKLLLFCIFIYLILLKFKSKIVYQDHIYILYELPSLQNYELELAVIALGGFLLI